MEVTIEVNGVAAKEYHDPDADEQEQPDLHLPPGRDIRPYQVKYIEAKPGVRFGFRIRRGRRFQHFSDHIGYEVSLDGLTLGMVHDSGRGTTADFVIDKFNTGDRSCWFKFANLEVGKFCNHLPILPNKVSMTPWGRPANFRWA